jgi:hypothetical protein
MDQVLSLPVGGHRPGDPLFRVRNRRMNQAPDLFQSGLQGFILHGNVFIDILRLYTVMILILFAEFSAAFGAFPSHRFTSVN